jgi:hypothetical protein
MGSHGVDAGHPFQTHRGFVMLVEHVYLGEIADSKKGPVEIDDVPDPECPDEFL